MIRLLGLAISIGIADSVNPTTIAPALYLASGRHPRRQVAEFTLAVFGVYLVGGLVIALGPGQLLLSVVPRPGRHLGYLLETLGAASGENHPRAPCVVNVPDTNPVYLDFAGVSCQVAGQGRLERQTMVGHAWLSAEAIAGRTERLSDPDLPKLVNLHDMYPDLWRDDPVLVHPQA